MLISNVSTSWKTNR